MPVVLPKRVAAVALASYDLTPTSDDGESGDRVLSGSIRVKNASPFVKGVRVRVGAGGAAISATHTHTESDGVETWVFEGPLASLDAGPSSRFYIECIAANVTFEDHAEEVSNERDYPIDPASFVPKHVQVVVKPLRPPLYPPLYPAPYLPASKSAPKPSYFHSLTEKPARSRPTPKQRKKVRGVATRLTSLLLAYGIEIIFCYFWVLGLARPTTHPYLRDNSVGTVFYAIAMVGFNILGLVILAFWLVMDLDLPLWRPTCGGNIAVILAVLVFVSGHIGAPFIATTVVQVLDFGNACYGSSWAFGTDGGGGVTLGGLTVGQSTLMDVDGDHIVASFKADAMALRASTNAGLWRNGTGLVDVEIVLDRGGKGNITGSCLPVGESGTTTPVPCMTGLLTARVDTALTGWFAPTTTSGTVTPGNRTLIAFGYPDWWDNPLDVTGGSDSEPSVALANTAAKPYSDQVKVCSNREDVAFVVMAVVNQLQGRASGCNDCWTHCTNCCREYCYEVTSTSTSCDSMGTCSTSTSSSTRCDCIGCSTSECRETCFDGCKGIGLPL